MLVPLVACIVGLAFYPQLILHRTDRSASGSVAAVDSVRSESADATLAQR